MKDRGIIRILGVRNGIGGQSNWVCIRQHGMKQIRTKIVFSDVSDVILFLSREDDYDVRDIGKHNFRSVLLDPLLSNADHLLVGAMRSTKKRSRTCLQPTWLLSKMSTMV